MKIKTGDTVVVISGKDNYKHEKAWLDSHKIVTHKVLSADPKTGKVTVEGVNVATKHQKPRKQGQDGGIIKVETPIYVNKVQLYCDKCGKGVRAGYKLVDGKKVRVCRKCGAEI